MSIITNDGLVHRLPTSAQGEVTTSCGRTDKVYTTAERVTCTTCRDTDICPNCKQRVELERLVGRVRTVTTTKPHIRMDGSMPKVCFHAYKTEEKR